MNQTKVYDCFSNARIPNTHAQLQIRASVVCDNDISARTGYDKTGILKSGGDTKFLGIIPTGEKGKATQVASTKQLDIFYHDQYQFRFTKGNDLTSWLTGHRGWKTKNVQQWMPKFKEQHDENQADKNNDCNESGSCQDPSRLKD